jgi:hypothetical protein
MILVKIVQRLAGPRKGLDGTVEERAWEVDNSPDSPCEVREEEEQQPAIPRGRIYASLCLSSVRFPAGRIRVSISAAYSCSLGQHLPSRTGSHSCRSGLGFHAVHIMHRVAPSRHHVIGSVGHCVWASDLDSFIGVFETCNIVLQARTQASESAENIHPKPQSVNRSNWGFLPHTGRGGKIHAPCRRKGSIFTRQSTDIHYLTYILRISRAHVSRF